MDDKVINAILDLIEKLGYTFVIGSNVMENSYACISSGSTPQYTFFDKNTDNQMTLALNGKNSNQKVLSNALNQIHHYLTRLKEYPHEDNFQIYNIETISSPHLIGREENNQWLYGSLIKIKFYTRGD